MSRETENITAAFRKARQEGEKMLEDGRLCWEDFCFLMAGYARALKEEKEREHEKRVASDLARGTWGYNQWQGK